MMIVFFWTSLVSLIFAMAAYNQADQGGWALPVGGVVVLALGLAYVTLGLPPELFASREALSSHPDELRFFAAVFVICGAALCLFGTLVGQVFRNLTTAPRIGAWSFVCAFFGLNSLILSGIAA